MTTTEDQSPAPAPAGKCLGKRPAHGDARTLNFARFVRLDRLPKVYDPWKGRAPFPPRSFGNTVEGCCTRASQAIAAMRFERLETRATPHVTDAEVHRVYREGCERHYGTSDDVGMYEVDALSDFRNPDFTFRDTAGRPITIDAFTQVNVRDREEVKAAIALSGKFGIKICLNLPLAYQAVEPPAAWDVPADGRFTGDWEPGSWGGHSLFANAYDAAGIRLVHSWYDDPAAVYQQTLTWAGLAAYADESYWLVDSLDAWRKRPASHRAAVDMAGIVKAVNRVSRVKVATAK